MSLENRPSQFSSYDGYAYGNELWLSYPRCVRILVDELRNELINVHNMSSTEDVDKVTDATNEILQATDISDQEAAENLEAIDTVMSSYQVRVYRHSLQCSFYTFVRGEKLQYWDHWQYQHYCKLLQFQLCNEYYSVYWRSPKLQAHRNQLHIVWT